MNMSENKKLMAGVFAELANGNGKPFVEALGEDVRWTIIGDTAWSGTWKGIEAVREELLDPLFAQFEGHYRAQAVRLIAEGDWVVIESRGDVTTRAGKPYRNAYCYVCRIADAKVRELTEYCDTQLLTRALDPPPAAQPAST
jgi:ketosteroid isomerase-like protein